MKNKKVFLNGKEITEGVKSIEMESQLAILSARFSWEHISEFTISYINWGTYKAWDWDEIKIVEIKKPKPKPKFKIWDYAVHEAPSWISYIKIFSITLGWWGSDKFQYNKDWCLYTSQDSLRKPTKEELKLYFR